MTQGHRLALPVWQFGQGGRDPQAGLPGQQAAIGGRTRVDLLRRFVKFPADAQPEALALWVLHTHAISAATSTPYVYVYSPVPRCGKSTLFELLALLVRAAKATSNITPAAIFRLIEQEGPTLLIDEMDAVMKSDREKASAIQSILNGGYRRGPMSVVWRCAPTSHAPQPFNTFCGKAFAGIGLGNLHTTTQDRSISILLERRLPDDDLERLVLDRVEVEADALQTRITDWVSNVHDDA